MQMDRQKEKISFKPLHDGVGFHPFSEGLPYARVGAGAMSAGAPSFAIPKTTRQLHQQKTQGPAPMIHATPTAMPASSLRRKRAFAYLLDTVIHLGFWISINLIATVGFHFELDGTLLEKNWVGFLSFFIFSQWFFIAMQEVLFRGSIGKFFFGLEFKRNRNSFFGSSLLLRSLVFLFGALFAGVGLYFLPQDKIAGIQLKQS